MSHRLALCATFVAVAMLACPGPGEPESSGANGETTYDVDVAENPVKAEPIDDTAPPPTAYDATLSYTARSGGTENHSTDRYRFDVAPFESDAERVDAERLFPSHAAHLAAHPGALPSVQTIGTYEKQLDDQLYAGVELAVERGLAPTLESKRTILTESLAELAAHRTAGGDQALVVIAAALEVGGADAAVPADLVAAVEAAKAAFTADAKLSKPIGFYTWSAELEQVWAQDRLLQQDLPSAASACAFAAAIAADPARAQRYRTLVALTSRMTNPLESSLVDLLPSAGTPACAATAADSPHAFLSPSRTPEVALFRKLYPDGVPEGADLMQDLVDAIRAGALDLAPAPDDGWYAHQLFALETLLVTDRSEERAKVAFMARYKKRLQEAFETMVTQHRETHVKQADTGAHTTTTLLPPPTPSFRVEPLATVFVRHARSYVFLEAALDAVMGPGFLDAAVTVDAAGPTSTSLRAQLHRSRDLFFGVYLVACQDVGLRPSLDAAGDPELAARDALAKAADAWLLGLAGDPVTKSDVRVMIPIASLDAERSRYWAVIGVRTTVAGYSFLDGADVSTPPLGQQTRAVLPTEQFLEVTSSAVPLTREEFRKLCDAQKTADRIQAALEAR